jgi:hypothetical protein
MLSIPEDTHPLCRCVSACAPQVLALLFAGVLLFRKSKQGDTSHAGEVDFVLIFFFVLLYSCLIKRRRKFHVTRLAVGVSCFLPFTSTQRTNELSPLLTCFKAQCPVRTRHFFGCLATTFLRRELNLGCWKISRRSLHPTAAYVPQGCGAVPFLKSSLEFLVTSAAGALCWFSPLYRSIAARRRKWTLCTVVGRSLLELLI